MSRRTVLFVMLTGLCLLPIGCKKQRQVAPLPNYYQQAEAHFEVGHYDRAAEAYEAYLNTAPPGEHLDRVLFRLALAHALPESPVHDWQKAVDTFQRLVHQFPQSPYRPEAVIIVALQAEVQSLKTDVGRRDTQIKALRNELDKLKSIDLERRPTKPPER